MLQVHTHVTFVTFEPYHEPYLKVATFGYQNIGLQLNL